MRRLSPVEALCRAVSWWAVPRTCRRTCSRQAGESLLPINWAAFGPLGTVGRGREPENIFRPMSARVVTIRLQAVTARQEVPMAQPQAKHETKPQAQPQVKGGVIPYLTVNGAVKAVEFYKKAFAAEVAHVHPPDEQGRTMHAHVYINGSSLMMSDAYPEHGHPLREPAAFNVMLPVKDVDAWYERAVKAGCTAVMPPADMFWGDRYGQLKDPFGITWAIN